MRKACTVHLKTIIEVGQLGSYKNIYQASMIAMLAGADFVKTSTGKECSANATVPVCLVMLMAISDFYQNTGIKVNSSHYQFQNASSDIYCKLMSTY